MLVDMVVAVVVLESHGIRSMPRRGRGNGRRGHDAKINTGLLAFSCLLAVGPQAMVTHEHIHVCQTQKTQNRDHENLHSSLEKMA